MATAKPPPETPSEPTTAGEVAPADQPVPDEPPAEEEGATIDVPGLQRQVVPMESMENADTGEGKFPGDPNTYPDPENPPRSY